MLLLSDTGRSVTADTIENALVIAPRGESVLFTNRDKFDLVGIYDNTSETFGDSNSPLSILTRAIYEVALRKFLKHPPVLLVGGLQAWKKEYGESELVRGEGSASATKSSGGVTGLAHGLSSVSLNGMSSPPPPSYVEPRSGGGHVRAPAETSSIPATTPVSSGDQTIVGRTRAETVSTLENRKPAALPLPNGHYTGDHPVSLRYAAVEFDVYLCLTMHRFNPDAPLSPSSDQALRLVRKPAMIRAASNSISYPSSSYAYSPSPAIPENVSYLYLPSASVANNHTVRYPARLSAAHRQWDTDSIPRRLAPYIPPGLWIFLLFVNRQCVTTSTGIHQPIVAFASSE